VAEWWSGGGSKEFLFASIRSLSRHSVAEADAFAVRFTGSSLALERRAIPFVPVENLTGLYVLNCYCSTLFRKNKLPVSAVLNRKDFT
jgi:hypothetical protein